MEVATVLALPLRKYIICNQKEITLVFITIPRGERYKRNE